MDSCNTLISYYLEISCDYHLHYHILHLCIHCCFVFDIDCNTHAKLFLASTYVQRIIMISIVPSSPFLKGRERTSQNGLKGKEYKKVNKMGRDVKNGRRLKKRGEMGNFWKETLKNVMIEKCNNIFAINDYVICTVFHLYVRIMNINCYVFIFLYKNSYIFFMKNVFTYNKYS